MCEPFLHCLDGCLNLINDSHVPPRFVISSVSCFLWCPRAVTPSVNAS
jgi:hypothetical protein